jgi:wobble nucleotide-excising tRNase
LENNEKNVEKIEEEIKSLEKTLDEIQTGCPHANYTIKYISDTNSPKRVCDNCNKDLGYANDKS